MIHEDQEIAPKDVVHPESRTAYFDGDARITSPDQAKRIVTFFIQPVDAVTEKYRLLTL